MLSPSPLVFWLDVDNTLLDNDRFSADVSAWLDQAFGVAERERYWAIYRALREQLGYADYLGAVQQFRAGATAQAELQRMSEFLLEYPFAERLYPHALETIAPGCRRRRWSFCDAWQCPSPLGPAAFCYSRLALTPLRSVPVCGDNWRVCTHCGPCCGPSSSRPVSPRRR